MLKDVIEEAVANGDRVSAIEQPGPSLDTDYFSSTGRDFVYYPEPDRS